MPHQVDLTKYQQFVQQVTSDPSNDTTVLLESVEAGVNVSLLVNLMYITQKTGNLVTCDTV
jgi:hypothetical protein